MLSSSRHSRTLKEFPHGVCNGLELLWLVIEEPACELHTMLYLSILNATLAELLKECCQHICAVDFGIPSFYWKGTMAGIRFKERLRLPMRAQPLLHLRGSDTCLAG